MLMQGSGRSYVYQYVVGVLQSKLQASCASCCCKTSWTPAAVLFLAWQHQLSRVSPALTVKAISAVIYASLHATRIGGCSTMRLCQCLAAVRLGRCSLPSPNDLLPQHQVCDLPWLSGTTVHTNCVTLRPMTESQLNPRPRGPGPGLYHSCRTEWRNNAERYQKTYYIYTWLKLLGSRRRHRDPATACCSRCMSTRPYYSI